MGYLLYHLVRADFLERFRRYSTLIVVGLTVYATYVYLPPLDSGYLTFNMGGYRGIYNSAWVGSVVTVLTVIFMALPGFYLVKNAIERDRQTGVGQIIAATPLRGWQYVAAKAASNLVFLGAMAAIALLAAVAMQLLRGEVLAVSPWDYVGPWLLISLPMLAIVAATAVVFECVPWLRGSLGNVVFFFLYVAGLTALALAIMPALKGIVSGATPVSAEVLEPTGTFSIFKSMFVAGKAQNPAFTGALVLGSTSVSAYGSVTTFIWDGIVWSGGALLGRLFWVAVAAVEVGIAALVFDRFDQAVEPRRGKPADEGTDEAANQVDAPVAPARPAVAVSPRALTVVKRAGAVGAFARLTLAEIRLAAKGMPWWWFVVAAALLVGGLVLPLEQARSLLLPLAWLWPIALWSPLANRDVRARTWPLAMSGVSPIARQMAAGWTAGFLIALVTGAGAGLRLLLAGDVSAAVAWLVAAAFIPSLAVALGAWTESGKAFEVVYVVLWYLGPMNHVPALDYIGVSPAALAAGVPLYYLALAVALVAVAVAGRQRRQLAT